MSVTYSVELLEATINKQVERIEELEAALRDAAVRIEGLNPAIQKSVDDWRERGERIEALEAALHKIDDITIDHTAMGIARKALASAALAPEERQVTRTLWELLREHKIDLTTAQHICNDAMINGVSVPCETARIEALEAALRLIRDDGRNCTDHCRRQADRAFGRHRKLPDQTEAEKEQDR
jgi:hypothetical protein